MRMFDDERCALNEGEVYFFPAIRDETTFLCMKR